MEQKIIDLFDRYTHGGLNRRDFLERLTLLAGSTAAATALLPALENNYAHAEVVAENDPDIVAGQGLAYVSIGRARVNPEVRHAASREHENR